MVAKWMQNSAQWTRNGERCSEMIRNRQEMIGNSQKQWEMAINNRNSQKWLVVK